MGSLRACAALAVALCVQPAAGQTTEDFFSPDVLHEIRLQIRASDWQALRAKFTENIYYPCNFRWRYQGRDLEVTNIGIRSRGGGSRSGEKPGLRVDFNRFEATQQLLGLRSVILRNNTQDSSLMRERLCMLLFRRMGFPVPREAHARLYINEQYFGLYTIVESIDKLFLKRHFGEDNGHLYEYQWAEPYYFTYRGPQPSLYSPVPFKPETHEQDPDAAPLAAMIRTINQAADADFARTMAEYLDLKLALAHVAVENFLAETDGVVGYAGMNNFYIYRFERKNLFQFIHWDKSETFQAPEHPIFWNVPDNVLTQRAMGIPELRRAYLETLVQSAVAAGAEGGWLDREIVRAYNQIRESAYEDTNKQCPDSQGALRPCSNEQFETGVARLRQFARERSEFVLREAAAEGFLPDASQINDGGAVNAASNSGAVLAPGSLVSLYGRFGNATEAAGSLPLPAALGGISVIVNGFPAPLLYVSPTQVNLQLPWELPAGSAPVSVLVSGAPGNTISVKVGPVSPGIFVVVHADGTLVSNAQPATAGEVLVAYANGLGPVTGAPITGQAAPFDPLATTVETPKVAVDSLPAEVLFSGLTPGFVGLYQVNMRVPTGVQGGARPLVLSVGGVGAPPVPLAVR